MKLMAVFAMAYFKVGSLRAGFYQESIFIFYYSISKDEKFYFR